MISFLYDGSFEGLMTVVYHAYYQKVHPQSIQSQNSLNQESLFDDYMNVQTDFDKSEKVVTAIKEKISLRVLKNVIYAFLSESSGIELEIFDYIKLAFNRGNKIIQMLTHDTVHRIDNKVRAVSREKHRMLGLLRFKNVEGDLYYAPMNPKFNIISLLAPHFTKRLSDQNWMIHDVNRSSAVIFNKKDWFETDIQVNYQPTLTQEEEFYQALWKTFFDTIAIKERTNLKLQMQFVPKRYWAYLPEMD